IAGVAFQLSPHRPRSLADAGRFGTQLGIGHHFFHVTEPVGPVAEALAGERTRVARHIVFKRPRAAAQIAAGLTLTALSLIALPLTASLAGLPLPTLR